MKRTGDWGRKKPLRNTKPMASRSAPMPRARVERTDGPPQVKLRPVARKWRPSWPSGLRDQVYVAAGSCCDICGQALSAKRWECHHRRLKSQGGEDERGNLLALHDACHSLAHRHRAWARECGYIVHRGDDPQARPVWRHGRSWQLPTEDGWVPCAPPVDVPGPDGPTPLTERSAA